MAQAARKLQVLLTGGTAGIGLGVCKKLVGEGHSVLVLCRDLQRYEQTHRQFPAAFRQLVTPVVCDVGCLASVRTAAAEINAKHRHLDVVILNAGIMNTRLKTTQEGFEETLAVNHMGQFLLAHELLPLLLKGENPRLVLVSSELHKRAKVNQTSSLFQLSPACQSHVAGAPAPGPFKGMEAYAITKLFNVWTGRVLAQRAGNKLWVASVSPGFVPSTSLNRDSWWLARLAMKYLFTWMSVGVSVDEGAGRVFHVSVDPEALSAAPSGSYWAKRQPDPGSDLSRDMGPAQEMWDTSMKILDLKDFLGPPGEAS